MDISEYKQLFLSESQEILNALNNAVVRIEKEPTDVALLNELFRLSHTLKSLAQSMGYEEIAKLTHSMEAGLALLRSGRLKADKDTVDLLFKSLDVLGDLVAGVSKGKAKKVDVTFLVEEFEEIASSAFNEANKHEEKMSTKSALDDIDSRYTRETQSEAQTVRVPLTQLDSIMDVAGELVINKIRLDQIARTIEHSALEETVAQISTLTSRLQDQMMQIRLVPIQYIFTAYPRLVRDMAVSQKKEVDLLIEGGHIGLDRSIQDEINEPLLHLLKNAIIHGIEMPEEREMLGKPRRGTIKLAARRERDFSVIELSDDGRGIDIGELKKGALKRRLIKKEELSTLTPKEAIMLITYPGYSRAEKVTEAAGRGVGLNASRVKVESFGGTLNIESRPNEGTTFFVKLPLTMSIVQTMLVGIADETYCIPLSYITETIKVAPQEIKTIEHHEVISFRNTVLPLISARPYKHK